MLFLTFQYLLATFWDTGFSEGLGFAGCMRPSWIEVAAVGLCLVVCLALGFVFLVCLLLFVWIPATSSHAALPV